MKYPCNPVLRPGTGEDWDIKYISSPTVIVVEGLYRLYYVGGRSLIKGEIGYAESLDGLHWTKQEVILETGPDDFDSARLVDMTIFFKDDLFHIWYTALDENDNYSIGYATSTDGLEWKKRGPITLDRGSLGEFDSAFIFAPTVIYHNDNWLMWYTGHNGTQTRIGCATSSNGLFWTKVGMVLDLGEPGAFDEFSIIQSDVFWQDSMFHMYYIGIEQLTAKRRIAYATSVDGKTWTKQGIALDLGAEGEWDDYQLQYPSVIPGNTERMWFGATNQMKEFAIGYAERNIAPQIDHPDDINLNEDNTDQLIVWNPNDDNPSWYIVTVQSDLISKGPWEGYIVNQGPWDGSSISVTLDGLAAGTYMYELVVVDEAGQSASDQVQVDVSSSTISTMTVISEFPVPEFWILLMSISVLLSWIRRRTNKKSE